MILLCAKVSLHLLVLDEGVLEMWWFLPAEIRKEEFTVVPCVWILAPALVGCHALPVVQARWLALWEASQAPPMGFPLLGDAEFPVGVRGTPRTFLTPQLRLCCSKR